MWRDVQPCAHDGQVGKVGERAKGHAQVSNTRPCSPESLSHKKLHPQKRYIAGSGQAESVQTPTPAVVAGLNQTQPEFERKREPTRIQPAYDTNPDLPADWSNCIVH